jgi:peptidoglycan/LPS O-acetylase OafA/YrhL
MRSTVATIAALAASFWLLRHDGAWDTYRQPLFLPFLSAALMMVVFSTTAAAGDRRDWRRLVIAVAGLGAAVAAVAGVLASRNPIFDLHGTDIVFLAVLQALVLAGAGAATELGERHRPGSWIRTAWCVVALMTLLAIVPRVLLVLHQAA